MILHARMDLGGTGLIGADVPSYQPMRSAYLSLAVESDDEADRICALLAEGGQISIRRRRRERRPTGGWRRRTTPRRHGGRHAGGAVQYSPRDYCSTLIVPPAVSGAVRMAPALF